MSVFGGLSFDSPGVGGGQDAGATLDGVGQYLEAPYSEALNPAGAFTIEAWAKVSGGSGTIRAALTSRHWDRVIDTPKYGYILYVTPTDFWEFFVGTGTKNWTILRGPAVRPGEWTHLVGTFDGAAMQFFVNGATLLPPRPTAFAPNRSSPFRIGAGTSEKSPEFFFPGAIDDVAVYNVALPAERVYAHYLTGRP